MEHEQLVEWLERIEDKIDALTHRPTLKDYYSTADVAAIVGRSEFRVREWCRLGRVKAEKRPCERGCFRE